MASSNNSSVPQGIGEDRPRVIVRARFPGKNQPPKELHYFCLQVLGELPRLLLEVSQTPYDSIMYFGKGEYKEFAPFGQLPVYKGPELGGLLLAQSDAVSKHIARETGLAGSTTTERAIQDMAWELGKDISSKRDKVHENDLDARFASVLEGANKMLKNSKGPYFGGSKLGYGDVGVFHALYTIDQIKAGFLKPWPELEKFVKIMVSLPAICQYLSSARRVPLTKNEIGKGHTGVSGYTYLKPLHPLTIKENYD